MSGILESIFAELQSIKALIANQPQTAGAVVNTNVVTGGDVATEDTVAPGELQLDTRGFPHDERIHAKTRTTNKDGSWKFAVGIDRDALVPQVEAELVARGFGKTPQVETPAPAAAATPAAPTSPAAGLPPTTPPVGNGLPPSTPAPAAPPKVIEFPVVASEDDMDDVALTQTGAALASKHGEPALVALLGLFQVPAGQGVNAVPANYKFSFWQFASNDALLREQSIIQ